jgi:hypothetical protein
VRGRSCQLHDGTSMVRSVHGPAVILATHWFRHGLQTQIPIRLDRSEALSQASSRRCVSQAQQELHVDRHACGCGRLDSAQFRADAAPGGTNGDKRRSAMSKPSLFCMPHLLKENWKLRDAYSRQFIVCTLSHYAVDSVTAESTTGERLSEDSWAASSLPSIKAAYKISFAWSSEICV